MSPKGRASSSAGALKGLLLSEQPASPGMVVMLEAAAMRDYLSLFLVLTLIAGVFGFVGNSGSAEKLAQILFASFAMLSATFIILIRHRRTVRL